MLGSDEVAELLQRVPCKAAEEAFEAFAGNKGNSKPSTKDATAAWPDAAAEVDWAA